MDIGLVIIRLYLGLVLLAHAGQKSMGWWGGPGRAAISDQFEQWGFRPGILALLMATICEVGGGALLLAGLCLPAAAVLVVGAMTVAITVRASGGFFAHLGGFEVALTYLVVAVALASTGPGRFSLDRALGLSLHGPWWALGSLVIGTAGAGIIIGLRSVGSRLQGSVPAP